MTWVNLTSLDQLNEIKAANGYSLIFKHSTRCSISAMAKRNFEFSWDVIPEDTKLYFLDLIAYREISNEVSHLFQVTHQSPQILLIKDGDCVLEASHSDISAEEVAEVIAA
ncbi:bacillithiol system redox-active protein YtxJ [Pedobacter endophyticus]|uniref:Bacillithiol system redox-active protein YtxJ n=1 Tax=Pedobacter endophyticus TaxID=2789740 RepID=A0A7S9L2V4_9SPHI|nr:bacillithiol system redox-active protein YtxJ [Pedobacter endophyticus]QPH41457.1 bacillithiol system redox-active protein YtxJ [Pedobacter endophyticus]